MEDSEKDIRIRELELECMHLKRDIEVLVAKYDIDISNDIDISEDETTEIVPDG